MAFQIASDAGYRTVALLSPRCAIEDDGCGHSVLVHGVDRRNNCVMGWGPARAIVDMVLPPRCGGCGAIVGADRLFCADCWQQLAFLGPGGCTLCNVPLAAAAGTLCGNCLAAPPRHDGVRAAVVYGPIARSVALRLKYGRRTGLAQTMAQAMSPHIDAAGIIVPVPLHRWRLWWRGFNQAQLVAQGLARHTGLCCHDAVLVRKRATGSMRGQSATRRAELVRGAFRTTRRLDRETVWLVDDIYTTGATANACAAALKRAGAERVVVIAWARVLRED